MKKLSFLFICVCLFCQLQAQLTTTPSGGNKKAMVGERIGLTDVAIHYDRPGVKGREGKIWGQLIPVGFTDLGFGSSKAAPWRAGALFSQTGVTSAVQQSQLNATLLAFHEINSR